MANVDRLPLVTLRNAEILPGSWRNFSGEDRFNAGEGKRAFNIKLPIDAAEAMLRDGFNIKELRALDEGDAPGHRIEVAVSYKNRPPQVWLISGGHRTLLDETAISVLDYADIERADVMINPSAWEVNGKSGIKAYLHKLFVTLKEDELDAEYSSIPVSGAPSGVHFEESDFDA